MRPTASTPEAVTLSWAIPFKQHANGLSNVPSLIVTPESSNRITTPWLSALSPTNEAENEALPRSIRRPASDASSVSKLAEAMHVDQRGAESKRRRNKPAEHWQKLQTFGKQIDDQFVA